MTAVFQKFSLKKLGAMALVFFVSVGVWYSLSTPEGDIARQKISPQEVSVKKTEETEKREEALEVAENTSNDEAGKIEAKTEETREKKAEIKAGTDEEPVISTYQKAIEGSDPLLCAEISDENLSSQCRDDLVFSASLEHESVEGCDEISDLNKKEYCKGKVLLSTILTSHQYDECEKIENVLFQENCKEAGEKYLLLSAREKSDCEKIGDETMQSQCVKQFLTTDDFKFSPFKCDTLPDGKEKVFCQKMTISSSIERKKKLSCSVFSGEVLEYCITKKSDASDKELYKKALETVQYKYCSTIKNKTLRADCTNVVVYNSVWDKKNIQLCSLIPDEELKLRCNEKQGKRLNTFFYRQAKIDYDKKLCLKIYDSDLQAKCIDFFE